MSETQHKPHAILFPYPYQGHVTPIINLAINLASRGITITFVQTQFIHYFISTSHQDTFTNNNNDVDIFYEARKSGLDIRYTTVSDGFPPEYDRYLNFDEYWETMFRDFPARVDEIIGTTLQQSELDSFKYFLFADTFYSWPAMIAKRYDIINVSLWTEPSVVFSIDYHLDLLRENGHFPCTAGYGSNNHMINYIPGVGSISTGDLMSYLQDPVEARSTLMEVVVKAFDQVKKADFILCNTVQEPEPNAMSAINQYHPTYAIGPINFFPSNHLITKATVPKSLWPESDCSKWLNSQPPASVLYVSFGSTMQSNKEEILEIARGLLLSQVNFIWVLRPDIVGASVTNIFPIEIENDLKSHGLMVPWCNQNMVLSSPSVGGFLTHCGWNSILESIWFGVPMICYPFFTDQPTNKKLVVDDWKIGINLCDKLEGAAVISKEEIGNKINMLMKGQKSINLRKEMMTVKNIVREAVGTNGSSTRNFDQFVNDLMGSLYACSNQR